MVKCGACGKFLAQSDGIKCSKCSTAYHRACVLLPETGTVKPTWVCPGCKIKIPRQGNDLTPVRGITTTPDACAEMQSSPDAAGVGPAAPLFETPAESINFMKEMRALRDDFGTMMREVRECRAEIRECRTELKAYVDRIECLEVKVLALETRLEASAPSNEFEATIEDLKLQLNERDQELLLCDLEIAGIPENKEESPIHIVKTIGIKLGIEFDDRDIVHVERAGPRARNLVESEVPPRPRNIVVTLARRSPRDQLLRAARVRRVITTAELELTGSLGTSGSLSPPRRIYLNERLTRSNKQLFHKTREAARRSRWRYVWTRDGRIYTRKEDGKTAERIRSENDLVRVFGC